MATKEMLIKGIILLADFVGVVFYLGTFTFINQKLFFSMGDLHKIFIWLWTDGKTELGCLHPNRIEPGQTAIRPYSFEIYLYFSYQLENIV